MIDAIYRWLMDRDFALEGPEVVIFLVALINIFGYDNRRDCPTDVLLMAAYEKRRVLNRPNMRVTRWRNGALSGSDLAKEPGLGSSRTYQPGGMPLPTKPRIGLRSSQLRAAVPPKKARVEEEVQTNETMQDLNRTIDELEKIRRELDEMTKTMLSMNEYRDMWKRLFEDCKK